MNRLDGQTIISETPRSIRRVRAYLPAAMLFVTAPFVAEFLSGNMSIDKLGMLLILAPLYGGAALLIREYARRSNRGWPNIFALALAYGIFEEAFLMQTLFNPDFLGKHLQLLQPAFLQTFGIGSWWTIYVLTLHAVWSISVPIAMVEAIFPESANDPWLGHAGAVVIAAAFLAACALIALSTVRMGPAHFVASRKQFVWSAAAVIVLITIAARTSRRNETTNPKAIPGPLSLAFVSLLLSFSFLVVPRAWGWRSVVACCLLDATAICLTWFWSRQKAFDAVRRFCLFGGAAMAYGVHAFFTTPSVGQPGVVARGGNVLFLAVAAILLAIGAWRTIDARR